MSARPAPPHLVRLTAALVLTACADAASTSGCRFDSDCEDGVCIDGACAPDPCPECLDASPIIGDPDDGVPGVRCTLDGKVERGEISLAPGVGVPFRTSGLEAMLAVNLAGTPADDDTLAWDLERLPGDVNEDRFTQLFAPAEASVRAAFPDADYLVVLPGTPGLLAFYDLNDTALRLLGIADAAGAFTQLVFDPPVDALRFPLQAGDRWETRTTARGALFGASVQVTDHYATEVRARGRVTLPAGEIPALQLLTTQTRTFDSAGFEQVSTTVDFLAECGGYVAKAISAEGERGLPEQVRMLSLMLPQTCETDAACGAGGLCEDGRCRAGAPFAEVVPAAPACRANGDGTIDDAEMPVEPGLAGRFRRSAAGVDVTVDLEGEPGAGGGRLWRFDTDALGAEERLERTLEPGAFWFGAFFPGATYAAILDAESGTYAVFERVPGELRIVGLASEVPDRTLLVYETPVAAMRFPMREGDVWSADTRAAGRLEGQDLEIDMHYEFAVDASGSIRLPAGEVPVLRQRIASRQQVVGAPFAIARQSVLFVAECLGGVARVVSELNETQGLFTTASEVSRLTVPQCLSPLQCGPGVSCVDGRCGGEAGPPPDPDSDAGPPPDADAGPGPEADGGPDPGADFGPPPPDPDGGAPLCNPEGDFVVTRAEFPLGAGQTAHFRIADDVGLPVDLRGRACADGTCWDLGADRGGDADVVVELMPVAGRWFAEDFPDATYVSYVDREQGWLGVFRLTENALQLLGTASEDDGAMKTTYDPPVDLYRFPLSVGDEWTVETSQTGYLNYGFVPIFTNDTYTVRATASGVLETPQGPFRAVQVVAQVSQAVPFTFLGNDRIVHTFVSECFGIVGRVVSEADESEPFFETASRIERLAPAR
jgi:hypothetical protein